jgi:hypothetical protein
MDEEQGPDAPEEEIVEVGSAIERLNDAIDAVNVLEDEHQAWANSQSAKNAVLSCRIAVLEKDLPARLDLLAALNDACLASVRTQSQHAESDQMLARLQEEQAAKQRELGSASLWQARVEISAQIAEIRTSLPAAQKAAQSARKASAAASSREEKARRALLRSRPDDRSAFPEEDEVALFQQLLRLREERAVARAEETDIRASMQRRKDAAADEVSAAMVALDDMSNAIRDNRSNAAHDADEEEVDSDFRYESDDSSASKRRASQSGCSGPSDAVSTSSCSSATSRRSDETSCATNDEVRSAASAQHPRATVPRPLHAPCDRVTCAMLVQDAGMAANPAPVGVGQNAPHSTSESCPPEHGGHLPPTCASAREIDGAKAPASAVSSSDLATADDLSTATDLIRAVAPCGQHTSSQVAPSPAAASAMLKKVSSILRRRVGEHANAQLIRHANARASKASGYDPIRSDYVTFEELAELLMLCRGCHNVPGEETQHI